MTNKLTELPFLKQTAKKHSEEFPHLVVGMSKSCVNKNSRAAYNHKTGELSCHYIIIKDGGGGMGVNKH